MSLGAIGLGLAGLVLSVLVFRYGPRYLYSFVNTSDNPDDKIYSGSGISQIDHHDSFSHG